MDKQGHPVLSTRTQLSSRPPSLHTNNRGLDSRPKQLKLKAEPAIIKKKPKKTTKKSAESLGINYLTQ
jgi:hypothetical protein